MSEVFTLLGEGFAQALTPANLGFAFLGVLTGTLVGVLPGIGPITAISLLIPLSFGLTGSALAFKMRGEDGVALACGGEASTSGGGGIGIKLCRSRSVGEGS